MVAVAKAQVVMPQATDYVVEVAVIPVSKLFVDHRYQRSVSTRWVEYLVKEWDWKRFLPLVVTERGGRYAVVDGQQRLAAAQEKGIEALPCIIVVCEGVEQEAELFLGANSVKAVTPFDRFRARLAIGEKKATAIMAAVQAAGWTLNDQPNKRNKPFSVRAIAAVEELYDQGILVTVLSIIREAWGNEPHPQMGGVIPLRGIGVALRHIQRYHGETKEVARKLAQFPFVDIGRRASARQESMGGRISPFSAFASIVVDAYNYKRQTNLLPPYDPVYSNKRYKAEDEAL